MTLAIRRLVYRHVAGPYPGLRQIVGLVSETAIHYLTTGETRPFSSATGGNSTGDLLQPTQMWPDGRLSKGMRLKSTDRYVLYQEVPA